MQVDCIGLARVRTEQGYILVSKKGGVFEPPYALLGINPNRKLQAIETLNNVYADSRSGSADKLRFQITHRDDLPVLMQWFVASRQRESDMSNRLRRDLINAGLSYRLADDCSMQHYGFGQTVIDRITYLISYWDVTPSSVAAAQMLAYAKNARSKIHVATGAEINSERKIRDKAIGKFAKLLVQNPSTRG